MVGRGWWMVVWSVYAAGYMNLVYGGSWCQPGQEYYSSQEGQCVPCTRCHDPLVVVVPCYEYRNAVCAPATQFLPLAPPLNHTHTQTRQPSYQPSSSPSTDASSPHHTHTLGHKGKKHVKKNHDGRNHTSSSSSSSSSFITKQRSKKEKRRQGQGRHFRHKHQQNHKPSAQNTSSEKPQMKRVDSHRTGASSEVSNNNTSMLESTRIGESANRDSIVSDNSSVKKSLYSHTSVSDNATNVSKSLSDKNMRLGATTIDKSEDSYLHRLRTAVDWQAVFYLSLIVIISLFLLMLSIVTLSYFRSLRSHQKIKRVNVKVGGEVSDETTMMERLVSPRIAAPPTCSNNGQGAVTFVRRPAHTTTASSTTTTTNVTVATSSWSHPPTTATSATYPSTTIISTTTTTTSAHPTGVLPPVTRAESGIQRGMVQPDSPIPFTMDRLLEQRRVLGAASSLDTNLYVESFCLRQHDLSGSSGGDDDDDYLRPCPAPVSVSHQRTFIRRAVSASPSPILPVRTYRPALRSLSASPSPVLPVRTYRPSLASASVSSEQSARSSRLAFGSLPGSPSTILPVRTSSPALEHPSVIPAMSL